MWGEILLLCLSGALYPVALVAVIGLLGSERPIPLALAFLAGGAVICAITGTAIVVLARTVGFEHSKHHTASAAVDIVLGVAIAAFTGALLVRENRRHRATANAAAAVSGPGSADDSDKSVRRQSSGKAFVTGAIIYAPMLSYFASVKIAASQTHELSALVSAVLVCIVVSLLVTEVPILIVLITGARSDRILHRMSDLIATYTKPVLLIAGTAAGLYLIVKGLTKL